jgi:hypothetical protein
MNPDDWRDEKVRRLDLGVAWDAGAPLPHLVQSESRAFLAFFLARRTPGWDGGSVVMVDPLARDPAPMGVVEWLDCKGALLGGLSDEAANGHRLWQRGLSDVGLYQAAEVANSCWVADLERASQVHPRHDAAANPKYRHFVLGFHDSIFECLASGWRAYAAVSTMPSMLDTLVTHVDLLPPRSPLPFQEVARG